MPTSRRATQTFSLGKLVSFSTALAEKPITVEVEAAEGDPAPVEEVTLSAGAQRWGGIIGFENEMTGDGRIISEKALRWPEDLAENPIPIRYVSSDVGAHDGAQVVGLIDTIERLAPLEDGSVPIYGEGIFDDAEEATVAQEAFRHVDKKMTNGVSMDLDDVVFEVRNDERQPELEIVQTNDARIRAVTIVAIPAFANARINILGGDEPDSVTAVVGETTELAGETAAPAAADTDVEEENPRVVVSTNSARGMRAHAITKAKLRALASRSTSFAYQTTKIKDPEGTWVETPAAAIDIATNSTPPDDSFQRGLDILNEADMLELGSEEYLAKVREAVPLFQEAMDDGGDRGPDAKKVVEILESYLDIDWPSKDEEGEIVDEDADAKLDETTVQDTNAPAAEKPEMKAAGETDTLASEVSAEAAFAFNADQWRNPHNGQWIDMPGRILGRLDDYDGRDLEDARAAGDKFVEHLNAGDIDSAIDDLNLISRRLDAIMDGEDPEDDTFEADAPLIEAAEKIDRLKTVDWFSAPMDSEGVGSFEEPEAVDGNNITDPDGSKRAERKAEQDAENEAADLRIAAAEAEGNGGLDMAPLENLIEGWINRGASGEQIEDRLVGRLGEENRAAVHDYLTNDGAIIWENDDAPDTEPETALEDGLQAMEQLEIQYDQDIPTEATQALNALDADDLEDAEKSLVEVQKQLQDAQDGYLGDEDVEGETRIRFLSNIVDALSWTIDRWKSEKSYNEGREFAAGRPLEKVAAEWAKEFNVPDVQVEEMLQVLTSVQERTPEWDELSSLAQGFVKMSRAGVEVKDALAIYLKSLEETGNGSVEFTWGARLGQRFNWVDEVGGLPKYIREIADSLMTKQGFSESRAIATAVETVKRWAKGGPARKGGKGSVSAKTIAKAATALAEWEAKKARANAAADTEVLTAVTASAAPTGLTQGRSHSDRVAGSRHELLARVRGEDVVEEAEAITAAAAGNAIATRPIINLRSNRAIPVAPPKSWFSNPGLKEPTPITVDEDGRVYGHLASWNVCHVASPAGENICIMAPKSQTGYAYFHTGAVKVKEGDTLATGRLCMNGRHADTKLSFMASNAHYDDTSLAVADVRVGEDQYGIWVAGAMRPDVTEKQIRTFRASPLSGDWRKIGGRLELTIGLSVNAPGYPVPRPMGLVASVGGVDSEAADHELISLVAAGMLAPRKVLPLSEPEALSVEDLRYLKSLAAREKEAVTLAEREAILEKAAKLRASRDRAAVAAFAARRKEQNTTNTEGSN